MNVVLSRGVMLAKFNTLDNVGVRAQHMVTFMGWKIFFLICSVGFHVRM